MANLPTSIKNLNTLLGEQLTEGGGGSSDFSTATVSLQCNSDEYSLDARGAVAFDENFEFADYGEGAYADVYFGHEEPMNNTLILYKGKGILNFGTVVPKTNITIDGNVSLINGFQSATAIGAIITGDCTITIS